MPLRTRKNQYLGVNAHLHSYWQAENEWNDFHNPHIGDLSRGLRAQLLPLGYTTRVEQSVQIRRVGDDLRSPRADIIVRDLQPTQRPAFVPLTALAEYALVDVLPNLIDHEHPYMALVVYEIDLPKDKPVAWIELLSPSNKARGRDRRKYLHKRKLLLEGGAVFVEIDYLHQTPPTFLNFGDYSDRTQRDHAQPYRIFVLDPRPNLQTGAAYPYEFAVDQPIPTVTIPLNGTDRIDFDFGVVYRKTFEE
ncbi:MAG: DUF4058 family protein, partial [Chloroflexota bacterium]|nr:DUF4058 family protein [Chloroflexota bacterium]